MKSLFQVDGKPFFSIGGQVNNSSSANPQIMAAAFETCQKLGLNTIAAPVHWELFEPEEGDFDYSQVDMLLDGARKSGLRLVILWFGTWKNGNSHYVPAWVKLNKTRFLWAKTADGTEIRSLSPICEQTRKADERAFVRLCSHIAQNNADGTVIGVQVENEPGLIGSARDFSPEATRLFAGEVPAEVAAFQGQQGTWEDIFGIDASEFFTAYYIAKYIDSITAAAKAVLDLPMYINVWLGEMYAHIPGTCYPSGGAVTRTFRFWKHLARHIDAICPDIYLTDYKTCEDLFETYSGEGNIFYLPESAPMPLSMTHNMRAVAEHDLTGVHVFGVDMLAAALNPEVAKLMSAGDSEIAKIAGMLGELTASFRILENMKPLIEEYQGTGKLYAVGQYEGQANQVIDFGDYIGEIEFLHPEGLFSKGRSRNMDNRHEAQMYPGYRAKGFIVYKGRGEFFLAGDAYRLKLYPKFNIVELTSSVHADDFLNTRSQGYVSVTEGFFTPDGSYTPTIRRNGDEYDYGLWVTNDIGVLHVQMDR